MQMRKPFFFILACHMFLSVGPAIADELPSGQSQEIVTSSGAAGDREKLYEMPTGKDPVTGGKLLYFPPGSLYPAYAADPFRVGFGIQPLHASRSEIPDTGNTRVALRAGGELGIVRSQTDGKPDLGWQFSLVGGFNDQNDVKNSLDNIGWDGHYGFLLETAPVHGLAFKLAGLHVSSHVGDEYMERTGRQRIGYTRQEVAGGVSWFMTGHWRMYTEAGWAFSMSNHDLQQPWRGQLGMEYESSPWLWNGLLGWYAAADSQTWEERQWRVDVAVQTGLVAHSVGRTWRLGVEWYNGRPPLGEFFQYSERYLSFGLWIDI